MNGVSKKEYLDKEILVIDYSDCKEAEMIERLMYAKELLQRENKPMRVLCLLNNKNYATPNFLRSVERVNTEVPELILKQAVVGLSSVQKMILKGLNLFTVKRE